MSTKGQRAGRANAGTKASASATGRKAGKASEPARGRKAGKAGAAGGGMSIAEERALQQERDRERNKVRNAAVNAHFVAGIPGKGALWASWAGAVVCGALGAAALWKPSTFSVTYLWLTVAVFFVGCGICVAGFVAMAGRSRDFSIDLGRVIFLHGVAPSGLASSFWTATALQSMIGVGISFAANSGVWGTKGMPLADQADFYFGSMLSILGIGLQFWWAAKFGFFPPVDESDG